MSAQFFEQVFLVNNIPEIAGIFEAQDMIKRYVYTGEWYMEKACEFAERFKYVNDAIRRAYSRNNPISCYMYINYNEDPVFNGLHQQEWTFGYDSLNNTATEICDGTEETIQITSSNCYLCGEYMQGYSLQVHNIRYCNCQHNNEVPDFEDFEDLYIVPPGQDLEAPIQDDLYEQEYQQYWQDYWYQYELDLNNDFAHEIENDYHNDEYYNLHGYENTNLVNVIEANNNVINNINNIIHTILDDE